jgi:LuxR family maltose regulon positive regulatory protein
MDPKPFDVFELKLRPPEPGPTAVSRIGVVNRLWTERSRRLATVVAPAGYGKTTVLAQWAARDERAFAWLTLDERDNDPATLLRHLGRSLHRVGALDQTVLAALERPGASVWTSAGPRLAAALASRRRAFVLVLDDADRLRPGEASELLALLADHVPDGSMLALAGRCEPPLAIARRRAGGEVLEIGTDDLTLGRREARPLLENVGVTLDDEAFADVFERTEGWPAGLRLAAAAIGATGPDAQGGPFAGDDRLIAEYFESELLSQLTPEQRTFLRRTAVLDRLCGPLCDSLLEAHASSARLHALARSSHFLVPLDRRGTWYRYHHLFRAVLRSDLEQREPELVGRLHRRALEWLTAHGDREAAFGHAVAAGDARRAARLLRAIAVPAYHAGRRTEVVAWVERFTAGAQLDDHPAVGVLRDWLDALDGGRADGGAHAFDVGSSSRLAGPVRRWACLLRAAACQDGIEQMEHDVAVALAGPSVERPWLPPALLLRGVAHLLRGESAASDAALAAAAEAAQRLGATDVRLLSLALRSLLAAERGDHPLAASLASEGRDLLERGQLGQYATSAIVHAASARALLRQGRSDDARAELAAAGRAAGPLTAALPWLTVQTRLALASAYVTLRDRERARVELAACAAVLAARPGLGVLADACEALGRQVEALPGPPAGHSSGLTPAELRLLPLLATHLSFREIGVRLFVSRTTIKTQAISAYRKLGVSSRGDAIGRAAELGLLADPVEARVPLPHPG